MISSCLRDVRSVSIYNLFYRNNSIDDTEVDENIATRTVHFLSNRFPHLESVTFWDKDRSCPLNYYYRFINQDQRESIYHLLDSFSGAFTYKSLPSTLEIVGLSCPERTPLGLDGAGECKVCKRICRSYPLECILNVGLCLPYSSINEIINSRRGGSDYLHSETRLLQLLGNGHHMNMIRINSTDRIKYESEVKDEVNSIIESSQVDLSKLSSKKVAEAIKRGHPDNISVHLAEESFDYLKTLGLPISNNLLDPDAIRIENVPRMVNKVMGEKTSLVLKGMRQISRLMAIQLDGQLMISKDTTQFDYTVQIAKESGVLSKIIGLLNNKGFQPAGMHILINITAWGHAESVKLEAIPALIGLLDSSPDVATSAAWALTNIVINTFDGRELVLQAGAIQPLVDLLSCHKTNVQLVQKYAFTLASLFPYITRSNFNQVSSSLPTLIELIHHSDETVVLNACWALHHLSYDRSVARIQTILNALNNTGVRRLITLLEHPNERIQEPVLYTVGYLVSRSHHQAQLFIDNNVLPGLLSLLSNENTNEHVTDCVCWIIENILSSSKNRIIQAVIDSGIVSGMIPILSNENFNSVIRFRVVKMVSCMARGSVNQVQYLVNQGCIPLLIEIFTLPNLSSLTRETITVILERMFSNAWLVETYLRVTEKQQVLQSDIPFIISKTVKYNRLKRRNGMLQQSKRKRASKVRQLRQRS